MRISASLFAADYLGAYRSFLPLISRRIEAAALIATDLAATKAKAALREKMQGAGLGRLGNAIGSGSDLAKRGAVYRKGGGFSASGWLFIRSQSERTRGAIEAYTSPGLTAIAPVKGRWLWIPTDEIQRVAGSGKGRARLTPGNWEKLGLDRKIGPLEVVKSINGWPLLVVKGVGIGALGQSRSARSLTKKGQARKGQIRKEFLVAFIAIPNTARAARISVSAIGRQAQAQLPALFNEAFELTR